MAINATTQKGFTFVELLLYVAVVTVVLGSIAGIYGAIYTLRAKTQAVAEVEQQGQLILQTIGQSIRNGSAISAPAIGATATSLTLTSYTPAQSPTVFNLATGIVNIKEGSATAVALNSTRVTVSNLSFQNIARAGTKGIIRITFTAVYNNPGGKADQNVTRNFYGSAALRGVYP